MAIAPPRVCLLFFFRKALPWRSLIIPHLLPPLVYALQISQWTRSHYNETWYLVPRGKQCDSFLGAAMSFGTNDSLRSTRISFLPFVIYRNLKKYLLLEVSQCFCVYFVCVLRLILRCLLEKEDVQHWYPHWSLLYWTCFVPNNKNKPF